jgi:aryl-phospho-beta-D-glucosidase BglC (GH1 family)
MNDSGLRLKGVNLGGWLLMEGYILHSRNIAESIYKTAFAKVNGQKSVSEFERLFRANFILEADIKNIAKMGASVVRLPFNYRLFENKNGFSYIDNAVAWSKKYGMQVILDLHAAPGSQNNDWHSDSDGRALLWQKEAFRRKTITIWEKVVDRYKDDTTIAGYDVLNEPVLDKKYIPNLKQLYKDITAHIFAIDKKHDIYLEGSLWSQKIDFLADILEERVHVSIHTYQPFQYTFNFTPFMKYPGSIEGETWNRSKLRKYLEPYAVFARKYKVRMFVGEFGINWRGGHYGEALWLDDILSVYDEFGFDYTYWTYKAIANHVFPDGTYQYIPNNPYIKREGPHYGWDNYIGLWKKEKNKIAEFWKTDYFTPNKEIITILSKHFLRSNAKK